MKSFLVSFLVSTLVLASRGTIFAQTGTGVGRGPAGGTGVVAPVPMDPISLGDAILIDVNTRWDLDKQMGASAPLKDAAASRATPPESQSSLSTGQGPALQRIRNSVKDAPASLFPAPPGLGHFPKTSAPMVPKKEKDSVPNDPNKKPSLLSRLQAPLLLSPASVSKVRQESAYSLSGEDYQEHIAGGEGEGNFVRPVESAPQNSEKAFVILEVRADSNAFLRAVIFQIANENGFLLSSDSPLLYFSETAGRAFIRGWVSPAEIHRLLLNASVKSVQMEYPTGLFSRETSAIRTQVYLSLKLQDVEEMGLAELLQIRLLGLEKKADFKVQEILGRAPGRSKEWIVLGSVPVAQVSQLMQMPEVSRLDPVLAPILSSRASLEISPPVSLEAHQQERLDLPSRSTLQALKIFFQMTFLGLPRWMTALYFPSHSQRHFQLA
ncbi:MAG: hypothetical protein HY400_04480 [Elusimicrobia bacterium]|nr:hypothetical protein [Elusimicrobiota bacterium]